MGASYGQFCPVAKAMELLDERWTLLVVRELCAGSERFNQLRRGLPRMSTALLSRRLHQLVQAGIVQRSADAGEPRYRLTVAGAELRPIVEAVGVWGARWTGRLGDADLDPKLLLWDIQRHVVRSAAPRARAVICFQFPEIVGRASTWWLVVTPSEVDVCDTDPGYPVDVTVTGTLRALTEIWTGVVTWRSAMRGGSVVLAGDQETCRAVPSLLSVGDFATVPRPVPA